MRATLTPPKDAVLLTPARRENLPQEWPMPDHPGVVLRFAEEDTGMRLRSVDTVSTKILIDRLVPWGESDARRIVEEIRDLFADTDSLLRHEMETGELG